jgi:hypothetical protein
MLLLHRILPCDSRTGNPLVPVVQPFDPRTRRALYAASNGGTLRRRTWQGCAFNRAAAVVAGADADPPGPVSSRRGAARAFALPRRQVADFIRVWDSLPGDDGHCTALLRDALLAVGLFEDDGTDRRRADSAEPAERAPVPAG